MSSVILAILIGGAFGFVLDRVGATNPNFIFGMLRIGNMHLMKTILLAIGASSLLLFVGILTGLIDPAHLSIKTACIGVFIGGLLLGVGFAVVGYCPGTGVTALATGRWDALFFILGGLLGAAAYMGSYAWVKSTGVLESVLGGKATLAVVPGINNPSLFDANGAYVGIGIALVLILIAFIVPSRIRKETETDAQTGSAHRQN